MNEVIEGILDEGIKTIVSELGVRAFFDPSAVDAFQSITLDHCIQRLTDDGQLSHHDLASPEFETAAKILFEQHHGAWKRQLSETGRI
jgi:hypothetical protein